MASDMPGYTLLMLHSWRYSTTSVPAVRKTAALCRTGACRLSALALHCVNPVCPGVFGLVLLY